MKTYPKSPLALSAVLTLALTACGGGSGDSASTPPPAPAPSPAPAPAPLPAGPAVDYIPAATRQFLAAQDCQQNEANTQAGFNDISLTAGFCYPIKTSPDDSIPARVAGGIAVNDVNGDGALDIYVAHGRDMPGKLFLKDEQQGFIDYTAESGIRTTNTDHAAAFIDLDRDGLQDLISIQEGPSLVQFFRNQGNGTFSDMSTDVGITKGKIAYSVAAGDMDLDGDLDLFFAHWKPDGEQGRWEYLWQNNGDSQYRDISDVTDIGRFRAGQTGGLFDEFSFTPVFADVNDDRYPDLLVAADFNTSQILLNEQGDGFKLSNPSGGVISDRAGMGNAVADYDNDGDLDWFVTAIGHPNEDLLIVSLFNGNRLYRNEGQGAFSDATDTAGVRQGYWGWGTCFADFNNDGFEDLFVVNGYEGKAEEELGNFALFDNDPAILYLNQGDGTFTNVTAEAGINHTLMGRGLVCYDYDRDGDLDIIVANNGDAPTMLRNDQFGAEGHFLNIRLAGLADNPQAVGARIQIESGDLSMLRELQLGNHYVSQNPVEAHFGLADNEAAERIVITWPGLEGQQTILTNVDADQFLVVYHPDLK